MNTLCLLDVDGVLNPYAAKPTRRPAGYETHRIPFPHRRKPLRVWLNPEHGPMILRFVQAHGLDLAWGSMWVDTANAFIAPKVGLPSLPFVPFDDNNWLRNWKYPAVLAYAQDRQLVWFDDEFQEKDWAGAREDFLEARGDVPTLLYHVDPRKGLVADDFDQAGTWLESIRAAV